MTSTGLQEFKEVLRNFREMSSLALKGTIAAPLIQYWTKVGPPPAVAVPILTSVVGFVAVMWTFHFWHAATKKRIDARMRWCIFIFCASLLASGFLFERFTARPGAGRDLVVCGYAFRPSITQAITADYDCEKALSDAEYDANRVWTGASIALVHLTLIVCWMTAFVSISMFISAFIILHRRPFMKRTNA